MTLLEKQSYFESLTGMPIINPNEFFSGQIDAQEGVPHKAGMGNDYDRGYSAQYQLDQVKRKLGL